MKQFTEFPLSWGLQLLQGNTFYQLNQALVTRILHTFLLYGMESKGPIITNLDNVCGAFTLAGGMRC